MNDQTSILALYKVVKLDNFEYLWRDIERLAYKEDLLGTIFITSEGVNGTLSGKKESLEKLLLLINDKYGLKLDAINWSKTTTPPFKRLKIKKRKNLLPFEAEFDLFNHRGIHIDPADWNELIQSEDTLLIDVRNKYETDIGTFKNSIVPDTVNFVEFPNFIKELENNKKPKKIAMFCTGGIRCEIASSYMLTQGFEEVYQLKGGILNYLDKINEQNQLWEGDCFVFDERVSVDQTLEKGSFMQCFGCRRPLSEEDTKAKEYIKGVSCSYCHDISSHKDKERFAQRQKQIELSEQRGEKHMGVSQRKLNA